MAEGRMSEHYEAKRDSLERTYHDDGEKLQEYVLDQMSESMVAPENRDELMA